MTSALWALLSQNASFFYALCNCLLLPLSVLFYSLFYLFYFFCSTGTSEHGSQICEQGCCNRNKLRVRNHQIHTESIVLHNGLAPILFLIHQLKGTTTGSPESLSTRISTTSHLPLLYWDWWCVLHDLYGSFTGSPVSSYLPKWWVCARCLWWTSILFRECSCLISHGS